MQVPRAVHGFGLFGPDFGVPEGGFCTSAFLIVEREGRVLAGRMDEAHADTWIEEWAPNVAFYEGDRYERLFEGWRFPATYLQTGEHPQAAVERVARDQLGLEALDIGPPTIVSSAKASRRSPHARHWDLLFVHRARGPERVEAPEHWAQLSYRSVEHLAEEEATMLHGDLVELLDG